MVLNNYTIPLFQSFNQKKEIIMLNRDTNLAGKFVFSPSILGDQVGFALVGESNGVKSNGILILPAYRFHLFLSEFEKELNQAFQLGGAFNSLSEYTKNQINGYIERKGYWLRNDGSIVLEKAYEGAAPVVFEANLQNYQAINQLYLSYKESAEPNFYLDDHDLDITPTIDFQAEFGKLYRYVPMLFNLKGHLFNN